MVKPACPPLRVRAAATLLIALSVVATARAENLVAVFSVATPEYLAKRKVDGKLVPQTYVVMKGQYLGGMLRDDSLEKARFADIVRQLAPGLKQQEFYPAKSFATADLLLVIHWGATSANIHEGNLKNAAEIQQLASEYKELRERSESGGGDAPRLALDNAWMDAGHTLNFAILQDQHDRLRHELNLENTAVVLGLASELRRNNARMVDTPEAQDLRTMLEEDRYFINVSAYDAKAMIANKEMKRVWTAKLSVRSPGVNFGMAAHRIGVVGGQYFGTNQDSLQVKPAKLREGTVEIKDLIIID